MANSFKYTAQKYFLLGFIAPMLFGIFIQSAHAAECWTGGSGNRICVTNKTADSGTSLMSEGVEGCWTGDSGKRMCITNPTINTEKPSSGNTKTDQLKAMIESLQKRVAALTKLVQQKKAGSDSSAVMSDETPERVTRNIGIGSKGAQVTNLQQCLANLGYFDEADMDPTYGPKTRQAVKQFQAAEGIANSGNEWSTGYGYVGPKTRNKLNAMCAGSDEMSANDRPPSNGKYSIKDVESVMRERYNCYSVGGGQEAALASCSTALNIQLKDGTTRQLDMGPGSGSGALSLSKRQKVAEQSGYTGDVMDLYRKAPSTTSSGPNGYDTVLSN